jgi:hypothetical protein
MNIIWKILHSRWTVVFQLEWNVLQWTLYGRYFTAGGQWYCSLNGVCYNEHYMEYTSKQSDIDIAAWMECVTGNIIWKVLHKQAGSGIAAWMEYVRVNIFRKILHSRWTVVLQLEWSMLKWTLYGRYFTAGGQCYCSLNRVCYNEHYMEDTSQQVDSGIAAWMEFVRVNIIWKVFHKQAGSGVAAWMKCVTVYIIWKVFHSRWTVLLQLEWSVLQWTLYGRYFTAGGQWYCILNGVCYNEHYMEDTSQQVDSGIAAWMECVTMNIIWKILHSSWTVVLQLNGGCYR